MTIRVDELGRETVFVIVDDLISVPARYTFEQKLKDVAQGYTKHRAMGGWYLSENDEHITVYRVANLIPQHRDDLITWLLECTRMRDLYVVYPDGIARGHCIEEPLHGTRDTGWKK